MAEPFSPEQQQTFDREMTTLLGRYPEGRKAAAILPALHLVQDLCGWIPEPAMVQVAERCQSTPERVKEVATFYVMYFLAPKGKYVIDVCTNISCSLRGAEAVLEHLAHKLGVHLGETSPDGLFTLREFECLGACGNAPCLQVNSRFHMDMTLRKVDALVEELKARES